MEHKMLILDNKIIKINVLAVQKINNLLINHKIYFNNVAIVKKSYVINVCKFVTFVNQKFADFVQ